MFENLNAERNRLDKCHDDKQRRDKFRSILNNHRQDKVALSVEIANLEGGVASEESELTKILRRIQRIQSSGVACIIGGIARRDPTACVEMLLDLSGSEAAHNANIDRLKRTLRNKEFQLIAIENEIAFDE